MSLVLLLVLAACGDPPAPPPLTSGPARWLPEGCGGQALELTVRTAPGATVSAVLPARAEGEPPTVLAGPVAANDAGEATLTLSGEGQRATHVHASAGEAVAELFVARPPGFVRAGKAAFAPSQCALAERAADPGCTLNLSAGPALRLREAPAGTVLRFGEASATVEDPAKGVDLPIDPRFAWSMPLAPLSGAGDCTLVAIEGARVELPGGQVFEGPFWADAGASGKGAFVQGLGLALQGPVGPPEVTGQSVAVIKRLDEGSTFALLRYDRGEPARLTDISHVAAITRVTTPAGSCGLYQAEDGSQRELFKTQVDLLAVVVDRATGARVAEQTFRGPAPTCGAVSVGGGTFQSKLPLDKAEAFIAEALARQGASAP